MFVSRVIKTNEVRLRKHHLKTGGPMPKLTTRDRLLDAAEELVALQGYANTSLREITTKADANLAAVNYHFGSKEGLVAAMLSRRLEPLNTERLAMLDAELERAKAENRRPEIKAVLRAFVEPAIFFFQSQSGGKHFLRMFSRIHADPDDTIRKEFLKHMVPAFHRFYMGFQSALPEIPPERLVPRIFFCIGAMGHGASMMVDRELREESPTLKLPPLLDVDALVDELLGFLVRGMGGQ
jgi:AcrR family transcriptional regulator